MNIAYNIVYILSIALQLAAGVLLVGNIATSKTGILSAYCERHTAIAFEDDGTLADYNDLKSVIKTAWINKIAFLYLCVGYLISILGEAASNKWLSFVAVFVVAVILWIIARWFARRKSKYIKKITVDDIPKTNGVQYVVLEKNNI